MNLSHRMTTLNPGCSEMSWRTLRIGDEEFRYRLGTGFAVIRTEDGKSHVVSLSKLTGRSPMLLERGRWKGTTDGMVGPRHIRAWVEKNLLQRTGSHK